MSRRFAQSILLHGWDHGSRSWFGPEELEASPAVASRTLRKFRNGGASLYGRFNCSFPGEMPVEVGTLVQDLGDSAVAIVDVEGGKGAPSQVLLAVPHNRLGHTRPELAFEFVSCLRFFRVVDDGAELAIHDYIEAALRESPRNASLVFSIGSPGARPEFDMVLSSHVEDMARALVQLTEKTAAPAQPPRVHYAAGS